MITIENRFIVIETNIITTPISIAPISTFMVFSITSKGLCSDASFLYIFNSTSAFLLLTGEHDTLYIIFADVLSAERSEVMDTKGNM